MKLILQAIKSLFRKCEVGLKGLAATVAELDERFKAYKKESTETSEALEKDIGNVEYYLDMAEKRRLVLGGSNFNGSTFECTDSGKPALELLMENVGPRNGMAWLRVNSRFLPLTGITNGETGGYVFSSIMEEDGALKRITAVIGSNGNNTYTEEVLMQLT